MNLIKYISNIFKIIDIQNETNQITFYSESRNDWPHFEAFIHEILEKTDITICYISSDLQDPGLRLKEKNFFTFITDSHYFRNWILKNIKSKVCFMTLPDLNNFYLKRSIHDVHYVYIHHSLASMHSIYREKAFNDFDTIFCCGIHHINETKKIAEFYKIKEKNTVKSNYGKLQFLINQNNKYKEKYKNNNKFNVLIAPSWGNNCIIESGKIYEIINKFLLANCQVTLRPHPQTIKNSIEKINKVKKRFSLNKDFFFNDDLLDTSSLFKSDFMISDWSGVAFEYAFSLIKPVIFIDTPMKINNKDFYKMKLSSFEYNMRNIVGEMYNKDKNYTPHNIKKILNKDINKYIFLKDEIKDSGLDFLKKFYTF